MYNEGAQGQVIIVLRDHQDATTFEKWVKIYKSQGLPVKVLRNFEDEAFSFVLPALDTASVLARKGDLVVEVDAEASLNQVKTLETHIFNG